jgi:hypothetical protein
MFINGEQANCIQIPAGSGMPESGELNPNLCLDREVLPLLSGRLLFYCLCTSSIIEILFFLFHALILLA